MKHRPPYDDLESQYTKQIEILITQINKAFISELKKTMREEGVDEAIVRQVKINGFKELLERFKKLSDKFRNPRYQESTFNKMRVLFENADKRIKKVIDKAFKDAKRETPVLKLKKPSAALKVAVGENIELISGIVNAQVDLLQNAVFKSMRRGFDLEIIEQEVLKQADKGLAYAKFVSRDQLAKAHASMNEERQRGCGIPGYIGSVFKDGKQRASHVEAYDNKFILWDKPPVLNFKLDDPMTKRQNEALHVGKDYQCRCGAIPAWPE